MSWIDDTLDNENRKVGLLTLLESTRVAVWGILDSLVTSGLYPELAHAYGLDLIYNSWGKHMENTYALFAIEWLEEHLPDDDDEEMEEA